MFLIVILLIIVLFVLESKTSENMKIVCAGVKYDGKPKSCDDSVNLLNIDDVFNTYNTNIFFCHNNVRYYLKIKDSDEQGMYKPMIYASCNYNAKTDFQLKKENDLFTLHSKDEKFAMNLCKLSCEKQKIKEKCADQLCKETKEIMLYKPCKIGIENCICFSNKDELIDSNVFKGSTSTDSCEEDIKLKIEKSKNNNGYFISIQEARTNDKQVYLNPIDLDDVSECDGDQCYKMSFDSNVNKTIFYFER